MGDRERYIADTELVGNLRCLAMEAKGRLARGQVGHFEILPPYAVAPSRADGLHAGLFGGEARGVALVAVRLPLHVSNLGGGINALRKARPESFDRRLDAWHFREVDARPDDHLRPLPW